MTPTIQSIVYKPKRKNDDADAYARIPLDEATLVVGHGIEGDTKGGHPKRQLNIMSAEVLDQLCEEGFCVAAGEMGEQIIVSGLNVQQLSPGERVQMGDAVIEVLSHRQGCERFEHIQGKPLSTVGERVGIMASVVSGGRIRVGDPVALVPVTA